MEQSDPSEYTSSESFISMNTPWDLYPSNPKDVICSLIYWKGTKLNSVKFCNSDKESPFFWVTFEEEFKKSISQAIFIWKYICWRKGRWRMLKHLSRVRHRGPKRLPRSQTQTRTLGAKSNLEYWTPAISVTLTTVRSVYLNSRRQSDWFR